MSFSPFFSSKPSRRSSQQQQQWKGGLRVAHSRLIENEISVVAARLAALGGDQGRAPRDPKRTPLIPALAGDTKDEIHGAFDVAPAEKLGACVRIQRVLPALDARSVEALVGPRGRERDCLAGCAGRVGDVDVVELEIGAGD